MTMRVRLAQPQVGEAEVEAIREVLGSGVFTGGPKTAEFERAFAAAHHVEHAVAVSNGTVALTAMMLAYGIGPGDEVVLPSMTFVSTATSVLHVGATPVFAEIRPDTFDLDPVDVASRITPRTRAILAVHYAGQPADLVGLGKVAADHGLLLLEDAAEAHGARLFERPVGSWGASAMFSFTPTKNITTGEGGMITTSDSEVAERLRLLRNHGMSAPYRHELVGYNWRLTEMQAAMGSVQLTRLAGIVDRKRRNARWLDERVARIAGVRPPVLRTGAEHAYMLYTVLLPAGVDRDAVLGDLHEAGVEAKVYFPPVHQQPIFAGEDARLPVTERTGRRMLSLPFHAGLTEEDLAYVGNSLERAVERAR